MYRHASDRRVAREFRADLGDRGHFISDEGNDGAGVEDDCGWATTRRGHNHTWLPLGLPEGASAYRCHLYKIDPSGAQ